MRLHSISMGDAASNAPHAPATHAFRYKLPEHDPGAARGTARTAIARLAECDLNSAVTALRSILTRGSTKACPIGIGLVVGAEIAELRTIFGTISAITCKLTSRRARTVATVVDTIVTLLTGVLHPVAALNAATSVAASVCSAIASTHIALLAHVQRTVPTLLRRDCLFAINRTRPRHTAVHAIVTSFTKRSIDGPIAAVRAIAAGHRAVTLAVRSGNALVVGSGVTLLSRAALNRSVAAACAE